MHACTMFLLPWGSLVAMEFSDPETKPSPNQLADIHLHSFELLITKPNSTSWGGDSSLKMNQTVRSQNVWKIQCFGWLLSWCQPDVWRGLIRFQGSGDANLTVCCINMDPL